MRISTKGRYALRTMIDLALNDNGGYIPLKTVSERQGITVKYLEQIITLLSKAGLVKSARGNKNGGYQLSKKPEEYTVGEILRTTEGSLAPVACLDDKVNRCLRSDGCLTLSFWTGLQNAINGYVDGVTLADLIKDGLERNGGN